MGCGAIDSMEGVLGIGIGGASRGALSSRQHISNKHIGGMHMTGFAGLQSSPR
jgi:hypothetical protein